MSCQPLAVSPSRGQCASAYTRRALIIDASAHNGTYVVKWVDQDVQCFEMSERSGHWSGGPLQIAAVITMPTPRKNTYSQAKESKNPAEMTVAACIGTVHVDCQSGQYQMVNGLVNC